MTYSVKYKRVFDKDGHIVTINDVTKENRASEYYSIGTHTPMVAALGDKNQHYFRAKRGYSINPETELHQYAKYILKYRFDHDEHFDIQFMRKEKCPFDNKCIFCDEYSGDCPMQEEKMKSFDLKEQYDTATIEAEHDGFVADVLLTNSKKKDQKPVFLEVYVTHPCSEEKITSGNKIIEIKVVREDDAYCELEENQYYCSNNKTIVRFHNFKREKTMEECKHHAQEKLYAHQVQVSAERPIPTTYYCIPRQISSSALQTYFDNIQIGMLFASNRYAKPFVFDKAMCSNKFLIMGKDIYGAVKPWVLYEVTWNGTSFFHKYKGSHFDYLSALKDFTIMQGRVWDGGETMSDHL